MRRDDRARIDIALGGQVTLQSIKGLERAIAWFCRNRKASVAVFRASVARAAAELRMRQVPPETAARLLLAAVATHPDARLLDRRSLLSARSPRDDAQRLTAEAVSDVYRR